MHNEELTNFFREFNKFEAIAEDSYPYCNTVEPNPGPADYEMNI